MKTQALRWKFVNMQISKTNKYLKVKKDTRLIYLFIHLIVYLFI